MVSILPPNGELDRSPIVDIVSYDLLVDLTSYADTFSSRARLRGTPFSSARRMLSACKSA